MLEAGNIQEITYKTSKKINRLIEKIDKKIQKAAEQGYSEIRLKKPRRIDTNVFIDVVESYVDHGFVTCQLLTRWIGEEEGYFYGMSINWEKE